MKEFTPEDIYSLYHSECFYAEKGIYPKKIKNFESAKEKPTWIFFVKTAKLVNSSKGMVDPRIYVKSCADFFKGTFDPSILPGPKAIKIYKAYISEMNLTEQPNELKKSFAKSAAFIKNYCKIVGHKTMEEYMEDGRDCLPILVRHYNAGSISSIFLACIPDFEIYISNLYPDIREEYFSSFDYRGQREKVLRDPELCKISDFFWTVMNRLISEVK